MGPHNWACTMTLREGTCNAQECVRSGWGWRAGLRAVAGSFLAVFPESQQGAVASPPDWPEPTRLLVPYLVHSCYIGSTGLSGFLGATAKPSIHLRTIDRTLPTHSRFGKAVFTMRRGCCCGSAHHDLRATMKVRSWPASADPAALIIARKYHNILATLQTHGLPDATIAPPGCPWEKRPRMTVTVAARDADKKQDIAGGGRDSSARSSQPGSAPRLTGNGQSLSAWGVTTPMTRSALTARRTGPRHGFGNAAQGSRAPTPHIPTLLLTLIQSTTSSPLSLSGRDAATPCACWLIDVVTDWGDVT